MPLILDFGGIDRYIYILCSQDYIIERLCLKKINNK